MSDNVEMLDWDGYIEDDGNGERVLLPAGTYAFTFDSYERRESAKGNRMIKANLKIDSDLGLATVSDTLVLLKSAEWKLSAFFRSLGMKKRGEKLRMDWAAAVGKSGWCKVIQEEFKGNDGEMHLTNRVKAFLDPSEVTGKSTNQQAAQAAWQAAMPRPIDDSGELPF